MKPRIKLLIVVCILVLAACWFGLARTRSLSEQAGSSRKNDELIDAINLGETQRVQALLDSGANPNAQGVVIEGAGGLSALQIASEKADNGIVDMLIKKGADINAPDPRGFTPLMIASAVGHMRAVKSLVAAGANVNAKRPNNETALAIARELDHKEVITFLEKSGAK